MPLPPTLFKGHLYFLIFLVISLTHGLFRSLFLNFQLFGWGRFPVIFLVLISNLIPWRLETTLCTVSTHLKFADLFWAQWVVLLGVRCYVLLTCVLQTDRLSSIPLCVSAHLPPYEGHIDGVQPLLSLMSLQWAALTVPLLTCVHVPKQTCKEIVGSCPRARPLPRGLPRPHSLAYKDVFVLVHRRSKKFSGDLFLK